MSRCLPDGSWPIRDEYDLFVAVLVWRRAPWSNRRGELAGHILDQLTVFGLEKSMRDWPLLHTWELGWVESQGNRGHP